MLLPPEVAAAGEERERGDERHRHHRRFIRLFLEAVTIFAHLPELPSQAQNLGVIFPKPSQPDPLYILVYLDDGATLGDLCEAVTTLEDTERTALRVLGGAHPVTVGIEKSLKDAREILRLTQ